MGISNCSNLCCKPKNKKETSEIFNIYEQDTNRQSQIPLKENQKDSIQEKYDLEKNLVSRINDNKIDMSNDQEIKLLINNINIEEISFPIDKNKLAKESEKNFEKIEKLLTTFYPCDKNKLEEVEEYLIKLFVEIKSSVNKDLQENELIFSGKLKKLINYDRKNCLAKKQSERFCVLYNDVIKYYKSEIQFSQGLKPLNILYLDQIARINLVRKDKNSKKVNYIIICNKYAFEKEDQKYLDFRRDIQDKIFSNHSKESIIIFTSDDENNIYKWFAYMEYLIYQRKNKSKT